MLVILGVPVIVIGSFIVVQLFRIHTLTARVHLYPAPFARFRPDAQLKFLFLGDSTCVGVGAADKFQTVAGHFGRDFPEASIENFSRTGKRIDEQLAEFPEGEKHYHLILLHIGGNDILQMTPYSRVRRGLSALVDKAKKSADHVVILHSGNIGLAPLFIWPLNRIFAERSRQFRKLYMQLAAEKGFVYVDLFQEKRDDVFLKDIQRFYAPDLIHPGTEGYACWYQRIRECMAQGGIKL